MVLLIIVVILVIILSWLLFTPVVLEIDTDRERYQLYQWGTVRCWLSAGFDPHLSVLGFPVSIKTTPGTKEVVTRKTKKSKPVSWEQVVKLVKRMLASIRVQHFYADIDTDDVVLNSRLIPIFFFLNRGPVQLATNYHGRVYFNIRAEVKLYRIGWALFLFFTNKTNNYGNEF